MRTCSLCKKDIKAGQQMTAQNSFHAVKVVMWQFAHTDCVEQNYIETHRIIPMLIRAIGNRTRSQK